MPQTSTPQNHGLNPGATPVGASDLLPKLKPTTTRQMVAMISLSKFAGKFRIAGVLQNTASFAALSGVSLQCGRYTSQTRVAPTNAPKNCAAQNGPTVDQFPDNNADAKVTAGLICAAGLPHATAVQIPATTAIPHAVVITIQPEFSPLVFFSRTLATTPSPKRINTSVPMNSPIKGPCIDDLPVSLFHPIERPRDCFFPKVIKAL